MVKHPVAKKNGMVFTARVEGQWPALPWPSITDITSGDCGRELQGVHRRLKKYMNQANPLEEFMIDIVSGKWRQFITICCEWQQMAERLAAC